MSTNQPTTNIEVAFTRAVKYESRLKLAIESESGAGKTLTALILGSRIAKYRGGRVALADSEHKSSLLYADLIDFDHFALPDHSIETYMAVMDAAEKQKYSVLIIDSTSHVWNGKGGALQEVDENAERNRNNRGSKNSFGAWSITRPKLNRLVDRINEIDIDLICTFRQKRHRQQVTQADGSSKIESMGMEMIGPNDIEYEFTIVADLIKATNELVISKTRCPRLKDRTFHALSCVEPIDLDKEPKSATHGMIDDVMEWLKGTPPPKQIKPLTGATKAFLELHDRYTKINEESLWDQLMEKFGLDWNFAAKQMDDPAITERSRTAYQILKATISAKELERTLEPVATQQSDTPVATPAAVPPAAVAQPDPEPVPVSPVAPAVQDAQPTPFNPRTLVISDFTKPEIEGLFRTAKATRPKGYNRASFLDDLQMFRGTREEFIGSIMLSDNNGGAA